MGNETKDADKNADKKVVGADKPADVQKTTEKPATTGKPAETKAEDKSKETGDQKPPATKPAETQKPPATDKKPPATKPPVTDKPSKKDRVKITGVKRNMKGGATLSFAGKQEDIVVETQKYRVGDSFRIPEKTKKAKKK